MPRGLFVTGTDTGVGKSVVSAALLLRYRGTRTLRYWKPIQTGIESDDDTAAVARLAQCTDEEILDGGVRLPRPVSPHLAARRSGHAIDVDRLLGTFRREDRSPRWIVEGAGGVLVPINDHDVMADLMVRLDLPVVVVARTALGTINHTLLTLEALRQRALTVAGVVMVGTQDADACDAIAQYGHVTILGQMPVFAPLTAGALATWAPQLDTAGRLREFLP
ncbi:MAG: dethiobiotin synthase [Acidobacteria bacterium]|nr:dethiobiotin synthase [Acidobacteriota bacterium]